MRLLIAISLALAAALALPAQADDGLVLHRPVPGATVRGFDPGTSRYSAGHRGVDLAAPVGAEVRASAPGRVYFAGTVAGRPSVSVDHGGVRTTYTPVVASVQEGQSVRAGAVIGALVGGHCVRPCLHWGLTDGLDHHDPLSYLAQRLVRLLPDGAQPVVRVMFPTASVPTAGAQPVPGPVTSPFGMRVHPVTGVYKLHDGTDFGAPCGTPIRLPWAGTVVGTDVSRGYGYRVRVRHDDGLVTAYAHLPRFEVRAGDRLEAGAGLGVVGNTGYSTGCHLHWMAWQEGKLVDPMRLEG
jgi:murein DD-endopeptidase MepM/ murein hydrolase activator NlpD